jgi:two-component system CitB family sensor kinase
VSGRLARLSVARQVLVLQVAMVVALVAAGVGLAAVQAQRASEQDARDKVLSIAQTLARSPGVLAGVQALNPTATLQPLAESVLHSTGSDFVVIMSPTGTRYTHPNPAEIGKTFLGHIAPAAQGHAFTETYTGTLGASTRAVVPVTDGQGKVVALISVGITQERIGSALRRQLPLFGLVALAALLPAVLGSYAVSRRLRRQTLGLGPVEITRMFEHHDAVLHAIREGVLVVGRDGVLSLANDEAMRLLGVTPHEGAAVTDLGLDTTMAELLVSGRAARDELHVLGDRVLAVNQTPALHEGRLIGAVTTLRDQSELQSLTRELASVKGFTDALRASEHEASNRLHTVVTLMELGKHDEAVRFATAQLAASQGLADRLLNDVGEPALAALLLGKISQARERGVDLEVTEDSEVGALPFDTADLVTVLGNLIDNALDAAAQPGGRVTVTVRAGSEELVVRVADNGPGLDLSSSDELFTRGWSTKDSSSPYGRGLGLALVRQVVLRHGGRVDLSNDEGAVFVVRLPFPASWVGA